MMASPLEAHIGYWMRTLSNHVSAAFAKKLEVHDVNVGEWVVLRLLFDQPTTPSELAKRIGMTKGAVSKIVDRLDAKKLLRIQVTVQDRRSQTIELSDSGRSLVPVLAAIADTNDAEFFGGLSDDQQQNLLNVIKALVTRAELNTIPTN